jgi:hypothetical protein
MFTKLGNWVSGPVIIVNSEPRTPIHALWSHFFDGNVDKSKFEYELMQKLQNIGG